MGRSARRTITIKSVKKQGGKRTKRMRYWKREMMWVLMRYIRAEILRCLLLMRWATALAFAIGLFQKSPISPSRDMGTPRYKVSSEEGMWFQGDGRGDGRLG